MAVHATKHRRLGCVAGLSIRGFDVPNLQFYPIENAYASEDVRVRVEDLSDALRFVVDESRQGNVQVGQTEHELWARMVAGVSTDGTT
jgi:hypothetical protein